MSQEPTHPMQPVILDNGIVKFKANKIVMYILLNGKIDLESLALQDFSDGDREQFSQLIGCNVDGLRQSSHVSEIMISKAEKLGERLFKDRNQSSNPPPHPMQPVVLDEKKRGRFKANEIIRYLLDNAGIDLNHLALQNFCQEDREQFAQLIGYSVSGYGELSYVSNKSYNKADKALKFLLNTKNNKLSI